MKPTIEIKPLLENPDQITPVLFVILCKSYWSIGITYEYGFLTIGFGFFLMKIDLTN